MSLLPPDLYLEPRDEDGNFKSIWHVLAFYEVAFRDEAVWDDMVRDVAHFDEGKVAWSEDYVLSQLAGMKKVDENANRDSAVIRKLAVSMMERAYERMHYKLKLKRDEVFK